MFFNTGFYHRTFPSQDEFSFNFSISPENTNGNIVFDITGDNNYSKNIFRLSNGKIFDIENRNVWSYNPGEQVQISGNLGLDYLNYFINKTPVCLYYPLSNNSYYNGINLNFSGVSGEGNIDINGRRPNYQFISSGVEYLATQDIVLELSCDELDNKRNFKIFSGIIDSDTVPYNIRTLQVGVPINNATSSYISLSGRSIPFLTGDVFSTIGAQIFTNFGTIQKQFLLKILKAPIYYTEWATGYTGISDFIVPPSNGVYNYELRSVYPEDRDVSLTVKYISGYTGLYSGVVEYSGNKYSELSGFIQGYDYITGFSIIDSGVYFDLQGYSHTGNIKANDRLKYYPTGTINYTYSLPVKSKNLYEYCPPGSNFITGTGILTNSINEVEKFLLGGTKYTLSDVAFSGYTDISSGIYKDKLNFKSNVFSTGYSTVSYTGYFHVDDANILWSAECVTGNNFTGKAVNNIFIDGKWYSSYCAKDSNFRFGSISRSNFVKRYFESGDYLQSVFFYKDNYKNCDILYPYVNTDDHKKIFLGDNFLYFTGDTGIVGGLKFNSPTYFKNGLVTHYSFSCDVETKKYPYIFSLQKSSDGNSWSELDSRTGVNFYPSGRSWFKLSSPSSLSSFPYYRLVVTSGVNWPHSESAYTGSLYTGKYNFSYGLRNLDLYESLNVNLVNKESFFDQIPSVYTGISSYSITGEISEYPTFSFPGRVIYSKDGESTSNNAWKAFNPVGDGFIYTNLYGDAYVGFEFTGNSYEENSSRLLNSFFINFKNSFIPKYLSISTLDESFVESIIYEKYNPSQIESGHIYSDIENINSYIFRFTKKTVNPFDFIGLTTQTFSGVYTGDSYVNSANFTLKQEILPNNFSAVSNNLYFGESFCISENGNYLFVSAPGNNSSISGSIYSYQRLGDYWTGGVSGLVPYPSGLSSSYRLGTSLTCNLDASVVVVGAQSTVNSTGAFFIYNRNSETSPLYTYKTGIYGPYYGEKLLLNNSGNVLLVSKSKVSSIDIFNRSGLNLDKNLSWLQSSSLSPLNQSITGFGTDFDLNYKGNFLVVGHPKDSTKAVDGGSAYLYSGYASGGSYYFNNVNILYGDGSNAEDSLYRSDLFGTTVATTDNNQIVCVGGPYDYRITGAGSRKLGAIWSFRNTGVNFSGKWDLVKKLVSPSFDTEIGSNGLSISSNGSFILAGSKNGPVLFSGNSVLGSPPPTPDWSYVGAANLYGLDSDIYDIKAPYFLKSNPNDIYVTSFKKNYNGAGKISYLKFNNYEFSDFTNPNYPEVFK